MRRFMVIWGYIVGKIGVRCSNCVRLKNGRCYKVEIPPEDRDKQRTCGFWKKKYTWIKRQSPGHNGNVRLKSEDEDE